MSNLENDNIRTLDEVDPGTSVVIRSLDSSNSTLHRRLVVMGLVVGQTLTVVRRAPFGGPIAITTLGYTLSLRLAEARILEVCPI